MTTKFSQLSSLSRPVPALNTLPPMPVAYITDVEGMWDKLAAFVVDNPYVAFDGDRLIVAEGAVFVFGGDAIDRGPWSRRLVRTLLDVKKRQPQQVVLLAGNRDINKLRLRQELNGKFPYKMPDDIRQKNLDEILRWIFSYTMGAQVAFEMRETELRMERLDEIEGMLDGMTGDMVDGMRVVNSYLEDLANDGDLTQYLAACQLAFRTGDALFLHGGISSECMGRVPTTSPQDDVQYDVDDWVLHLNAWYRRQVQLYRDEVYTESGQPAWQPLVDYQAPAIGKRNNPYSVVYGRNCDERNNLELPEDSVVAYLQKHGIARLIVGHTPNGDTPSFVSTHAATPEQTFWLICADGSHSRDPATASQVYIEPQQTRFSGIAVLDDKTRVTIEGCVRHSSQLPPCPLDTCLGQRLQPAGHLIKGLVKNLDKNLDKNHPTAIDLQKNPHILVFKYGENYRFEQLIVPLADAMERGFLATGAPVPV